jgi:SRSO17 transposase
VGKNIFACEAVFDHAAKANQAKYVWAQNFVCVGLLKMVKNRWACLPLVFAFYIPLKTIVSEKLNALKSGKVVTFKTKMEQAAQMILKIAHHFSSHPVIVVADSWFGNKGLYKLLTEQTLNPIFLLSRLRSNNNLYAMPKAKKVKTRGRKKKYGDKLGNASQLATKYKEFAKFYWIKNLYGKSREVLAYEQICMLKTLKCPVRVVWVYRKTQWVSFFTTDLELSVEQIISWYSARWKIESGFKELKQDIGSQKSQTRNAHAVTNHLQFCMMSVTLTWIYADRLKADPDRRHKVKGRTSFAFSDIRRIMAEEVLEDNFDRLCPKPGKPIVKSIIPTLLRMVA